jgi:serine/threonine-protein kinase
MAGPPLTGGLAALAQANSEVVSRIAAAQQRESQQLTEKERRHDLYTVAAATYDVISETLIAALTTSAPAGQLSRHPHGGWTFALGTEQLTLNRPEKALPQAWSGGGAPVRFDVIAHTSIELSTPPDRTLYTGRSHSLWFCDAQTAQQYAWFETAFWEGAWSRQMPTTDPYALPPEAEARSAFSGGHPPLAWPFTPLEPGDLGDFVDRWTNWLAQASRGQLSRPNPMPEKNAQGSYR